MPKNRNTMYQSGAAHVVAVICLVLALMTALGWIFWQNFVYKTHVIKTKPAVVAEKPISPNADLKEGCLTYEKLCFSYPASWKHKVKTDIENYGQGYKLYMDQDTLTSGDKKLTLKVTTNNGQFGGSCQPTDRNGTYFTTVRSTKTALKTNRPKSEIKYHASDIYAVTAIRSSITKARYVPYILLTEHKELVKVKEHEVCKISYADMFVKKNSSSFASAQMTFSNTEFLTIDAPDLLVSPSFKTYAEAKDYLESKNAKQAYEILKSVHY